MGGVYLHALIEIGVIHKIRYTNGPTPWRPHVLDGLRTVLDLDSCGLVHTY